MYKITVQTGARKDSQNRTSLAAAMKQFEASCEAVFRGSSVTLYKEGVIHSRYEPFSTRRVIGGGGYEFPADPAKHVYPWIPRNNP